MDLNLYDYRAAFWRVAFEYIRAEQRGSDLVGDGVDGIYAAFVLQRKIAKCLFGYTHQTIK